MKDFLKDYNNKDSYKRFVGYRSFQIASGLTIVQFILNYIFPTIPTPTFSYNMIIFLYSLTLSMAGISLIERKKQ